MSSVTADHVPPPFPPGGSPAGRSCRDFERGLSELERRPFAAGTLAPALEGLSAHARACAPCRSRYGSRLAGVEAFSALRARAVPDGLLDGMGERVLARARLGGSGGGMSAAFLDAPQSLARWRQTALAASVLLAVGAGLLATGRIGWRDGAQRPMGDGTVAIPEGALEAWDTHRTDDPTSDRVQPVGLPARGMPNFWSRLSGSDRIHIHPVSVVPPPVPADSPLRSPQGEAPGGSPDLGADVKGKTAPEGKSAEGK